jgi:hypothetical protein
MPRFVTVKSDQLDRYDIAMFVYVYAYAHACVLTSHRIWVFMTTSRRFGYHMHRRVGFSWTGADCFQLGRFRFPYYSSIYRHCCTGWRTLLQRSHYSLYITASVSRVQLPLPIRYTEWVSAVWSGDWLRSLAFTHTLTHTHTHTHTQFQRQ